MELDMSKLSQEQLDALMDMGVLDEQGQMLDEQMKQAEALGQPSGQNHITAAGAILGGLSDIGNTLGSKYQTGKLRNQQQELMDKKTKGRKTFVDLLFGAGQSQPQMPGLEAPPSMDTQELGPTPAAPFSYGYRPGNY